jgi:hypothetical protein
MIRGAVAVTLVFVAGLPASFVATLALLPLWRSVEARYGVEAVGHSGPAAWCYQAVYAAWVLVALFAWLVYRRRERAVLAPQRRTTS